MQDPSLAARQGEEASEGMSAAAVFAQSHTIQTEEIIHECELAKSPSLTSQRSRSKQLNACMAPFHPVVTI